MTEIETVDVRRLQMPLSEPYHLSHTTVEAFDVLLFEVTDDTGNRGIGEVTPLEGYSHESGDEAWECLTELGATAPGRTPSAAMDFLTDLPEQYRFTRTGISCALETLTGESIEPVTAPIVGILSTDIPTDTAVSSMEHQLSTGFETIKIKIGFDPETDASRLSKIVSAAPDNVAFRVDANQAYTLQEARRFLDDAPQDRLQLVEQPLPVGNLAEHALLNGEYETPIMLDEEIATAADLTAAADTGAADAVKFKLMKAGGWANTVSLIEQARDLGFEVVIGNGVQSDIACIYEAAIWSQTRLELAGEFNGWTKQDVQLTGSGLRAVDGTLEWSSDTISLSDETVAAQTVAQQHFSQ